MKVSRSDYDEPGFFYAESKGEERRLVGWLPDTGRQKALFFRLLGLMEPRVRFLFKEELDHGSGDSFGRVCGGIHRDDLRSLIEEYEEWFFEDSGFQFCYREAEGERNIAYDEHGLFFIYEFDKDDKDELLRLGAKEKKRDLITDERHWTKLSADTETTLDEFKAALKKASAFYNDEAEEEDRTEEDTCR